MRMHQFIYYGTGWYTHLVLAWFYTCGFDCFVFVHALSGVLVEVLGFVNLDQLGSVLAKLLIFVCVNLCEGTFSAFKPASSNLKN